MVGFDFERDCTMMPFTEEVMKKCEEFLCGNEDLDGFFKHDVFLYEEEMLGKSYCWVTNESPHQIVAVMTVSNDSIKSSVLPKNSKNRFHRLFDNEKRNKTYPATLIGRLGVNVNFQGAHVGRHVMDLVKQLVLDEDNLNACRFIVVDAYNNPDTLAYYEHNGFVFMHKSEEIERMALKRYDENGELEFELAEGEPLNTRMMYYDLKKMSL